MKSQASIRTRGFTLVELLIVVAILAVLASVAIPAFTTYVRRSKTTEAYVVLANFFTAAASYYERPITTDATMSATYTTHCTVASSTSLAGPPTPEKQPQVMTVPYSEQGIGLSVAASYFRFSHSLDGAAGCGLQGPADGNVYLMYASGDLDGDGTQSTFSFTVGTDAQNSLYKARAVFVANELE